MVDAVTLDSGWDFWVLALLVALLLPAALPAGGGPEPTRRVPLFAARLLPSATPASG